MYGSQEVSGELVVSSCDASKILDATKAALDSVTAFVGALVEGMDDDAIGFVGNDRDCAVLDDLGAQSIAIVALVGKKLRHEWRERQDGGR